jgi:hypothetical protein
MAEKILREVEHIARLFFSAPFENLPLPYGDPVPPDLRTFEAEAQALQREVVEQVPMPALHQYHSKPARRDESLERQ